MSCSFWLRRKKLAALKAVQKKNANERTVKTTEKVDTAVTEETKVAEKPVKKAVQKKNANERTDK